MNLHSEFDVSSSNRSRDMEGVQQFRNKITRALRDLYMGVLGDPIFGFLHPDLSINYTTFIGLR